MPTKTRLRKIATKTSPCKYCGEDIPRKRGIMASHVMYSCEKAPTREEEGDLPPGTIVGAGTGSPRKIRWTPAKLLEKYPKETWKTFTPTRSQPVTWGGMTIYFQEGVEMTVCPLFYDIYMESWRSDRDILSPRQPSDYRGRAAPYEGDTGIRVVGIGPLRD